MPKSSRDTGEPTCHPAAPWRVRDAFTRPFTLDLVWVVLPFALALLVLGMLPLQSWDYWWHLTMGRLIDRFQSVPAANHFLYTIDADTPSYIQPWISQWLLFWFHDVGGLQLSLLVRNLVSAGFFGLVGLSAMRRSQSPMRGAVLTLLGFALALGYIGARTHLFVWPLFGLLLWVGYGVRGRKFPLATLILFPASAALWANLHGSFLMPTAIALAFGAAAICDRFYRPEQADGSAAHAFSIQRPIAWFIAFALSLAAPLINPRGAEVFGYMKDLATNPEIQNTITEWMPTTLSHPPGIGLLFYATLAAGALIFWRRRKSLDLVDVFLFAGFAILAIMATRGVLWFALVAPLTLSSYLREAPATAEDAPDPAPGWVGALNLVIALGLVLGALILQPGTLPHRAFVTASQPLPTRVEPPMAGLVEAETPVMATAILQQYTGVRHLFHDQKYAGYLLYHLTKFRPKQIVFVDQRIELPPPRIWRLYDLANDTPAWKGIFQQFGVDAALLSKSSQSRLIEALRQTPGWELLYEDDFNALFKAKP